jgi:hypothetical protein
MSRRGDRRPSVAAPLVQALRLLGVALSAATAWIHLYLALMVTLGFFAPSATPTRWGTLARPPG